MNGWIEPTPEGVELTLLRFVDGPLDGATLASRSGEWPLPDRLGLGELPVDRLGHDLPEGVYVKISESQLPEPVPGVARGAEYRWEPVP